MAFNPDNAYDSRHDPAPGQDKLEDALWEMEKFGCRFGTVRDDKYSASRDVIYLPLKYLGVKLPLRLQDALDYCANEWSYTWEFDSGEVVRETIESIKGEA